MPGILDRLHVLVRDGAARVLVLAAGSESLHEPAGADVVARTCNELRQGGNHVQVLATGASSMRADLRAAANLRATLRRFQPAVLIVMDVVRTAPLVLLARHLAPQLAVRLLVRGDEIPEILHAARRPLRADLRRALMGAGHLVVPSTFARTTLAAGLGRSESDFSVFPVGRVNLREFAPAHDLAELHEDASAQFVVGCLSPLEPGRGLRCLVQGFVEVASSLAAHRIRLEILGDGPLHSALSAQVHRAEIAPHVGFVRRLPLPAKPAFLRGLHALVHPSERPDEALTPSMLEAMACGVPVIAAAAGEAGQRVRPGFNGLLFTPGSSSDLATKILKLHAMTAAERVWLARQARRTAQDLCQANADQLRGAPSRLPPGLTPPRRARPGKQVA